MKTLLLTTLLALTSSMYAYGFDLFSIFDNYGDSREECYDLQMVEQIEEHGVRRNIARVNAYGVCDTKWELMPPDYIDLVDYVGKEGVKFINSYAYVYQLGQRSFYCYLGNECYGRGVLDKKSIIIDAIDSVTDEKLPLNRIEVEVKTNGKKHTYKSDIKAYSTRCSMCKNKPIHGIVITHSEDIKSFAVISAMSNLNADKYQRK